MKTLALVNNKSGQDHPSNMQWLPREQQQDKTRRDLGG